MLRCDFPGFAVLAQSPEEPREWLLCQGSCGWPQVREITVTMLLSWTETAQPLPTALLQPSRAGGCWNTPEFCPSTHLLLLLWQNSGVLQHRPVSQKLRELPEMLKPFREQQWLCKPSPSSFSRNSWGFEVPRMSCWLQSSAPGSLVVLING